MDDPACIGVTFQSRAFSLTATRRRGQRMAKKRKIAPARVYKYRHFSVQSLRSLIEDELFYADPSTFNDPLDSQPSLDADLPAEDLEQMLRTLVERRVTDEMTAAARDFRTKGARASEHISRVARRSAERAIEEARYWSTHPDIEANDPLQMVLGHEVERELLRRYDRGVVSLAERPNCPLMWSHYGDQHRGVCFGYSAPDDLKLNKVRYGGTLTVKASLVAAMLANEAGAAEKVDAAVLLKKAGDWRYEREWRLIGERGLQDSPLELEEVVFGLRCPAAAAYTVARALEPRHRKVKLYQIRQKPGTFLLKKLRLDIDEELATWPRRALSIREAFHDLTVEQEA